MDIATTLVVSLLTSGAVSAVAGWLVKAYIEQLVHHKFQLELERVKHEYALEEQRLKSSLAVDADVTHELNERRLAAYSTLVELVYRTRNIARELIQGSGFNKTLADELGARSKQLEDALYTYRIDLERDGLFTPVHTYKNTVRLLRMMVADSEFYASRGDDQQRTGKLDELRNLYGEMESQHGTIIQGLSGRAEAFGGPPELGAPEAQSSSGVTLMPAGVKRGAAQV
jgi:hypothetical protein